MIHNYDSGLQFSINRNFSQNLDSDIDCIIHSLGITTIEEIVNYSFTFSEDDTKRDILTLNYVDNQEFGDAYYFYSATDPTYTLTFYKRTF